MAEPDNLIDFNVIEGHKENIQALPSGRSAKALAQIYSPPLNVHPSPAATEDANSIPRKAFEKELQNIDEADDPLDVYDRYVKWTLDAYPSAQATPQSQLLPLLERATKTFQSSSHYKNDPRYLRMWTHYIRLFSDAPREVFVFLARHGIGADLALYYEEFAAWLENAERWMQAEEIYKMGLEREARPVERLLRKFGEFERRSQARPESASEPSSPALPAARPALASKVDPFAASPSVSPREQQQARSTAPKKAKGSKMAIFADEGEAARPESGSGGKGWDSIGTLAERKKENTIEAKPMAGEKLKTGKTNGGVPKMMIFKDQSSHKTSPLPSHLSRQSRSSTHDQQWARNPKSGRIECVYVNLEAVYPEGTHEEFCFEELRARSRGWFEKNRREKEQVQRRPEPRRQQKMQIHQDAEPVVEKERSTESRAPSEKPDGSPQRKQRGFKIFEDAIDQPAPAPPAKEKEDKVLVNTFSKQLSLNDENDENNLPVKKEESLAKKIRRDERANQTRKVQVMDVKHIKNETKTIQLNMDSPGAGTKVKRKKSHDRPEPTMTINTKEAMDEIYGIFNQPLPSQETEHSDDEDEDSDDDCTTDGESTGTGKMSAAASDYGDETRNELLGSQKTAEEEDRTDVSGWSDFTTRKHIPKEDEQDEPDTTQSTTWDQQGETDDLPDDGDMTPQDPENPRTLYVPIPPEGYEVPAGQYRDPAVVANNRLPFMTPIVEHTESSLGATTARQDKDYFSATKTPSRQAGGHLPLSEEDEDDDDPCSSPFQEVTADLDEDKRKVLQPIRTKSTKGRITLGQGTAKSQIAAQTDDPEAIDQTPPNSGPIIRENRCNPMDPSLRETILANIQPPLSSYEGYYEHLDQASNRTAEIRKYMRALAKSRSTSTNPNEKTATTLSFPPTLNLPGTTASYTLQRELGAGTFAPVYLVENETHSPTSTSTSLTAPRARHEALKMEDPPTPWEFFLLRRTHALLGAARAATSLVRAHEFHLYRDECFLLEDHRGQGTLLDLVNVARTEPGGSGGGGVDEMLAMFFAVELLRTVEALHARGIIHGDLKGDNVLVRFDDPGVETDWSPTYFASGAHGWASKGVCLIDMGRGIDMSCFADGVGFLADWKTGEADCAEMREARPWTYQVDYYGVAGLVHCLLFGRYMEVVAEKGGAGAGLGGKTYRVREGLKRYWQTGLWGECFHLLLNPGACLEEEVGGKMPVVNGLRTVRGKMEEWLEENCERGMGLKGMIGKMEGVIRERKRKGLQGRKSSKTGA